MHNGSWLWFALAMSVGCSKPAPPQAPEPPPPTSLDEVMRRSHLAFWPEGDAFAGGHGGTVVVVDREGLVLRSAREATAALRFGVAALGREGREPLAAGTLRRRVDGVLLRESAEVTEVLENTEAGLEQSWRFARAPEGRGDLVVRVPVTEGGAGVPCAAGLCFSVAGRAFTYGHGAWVDAAGARTPVPARFEGGAVLLRVPAELLAKSAFPAVLDPLLSVEQDVDTAGVEPTHTVYGVGLASNGSTSLAVWQDVRNFRLMAARVAPDGGVLDPWGIPLGIQFSNGAPAVASDGTDFLVVAAESGLQAIRLNAGGQLLDAAPLTVASGAVDQPSLVWTGSGYLLVSGEYNGTGLNIVVRKLTRDAVVTGRIDLTSYSSGVSGRAKVAIGNNVVLVVYDDLTALVARRLDLNLAPLDVAPIEIGAIPGEFDVAWDGQRFVVTQLGAGLLATRVSTGGAVIDATPLTIVPELQGTPSTHAIVSEPAGVRLAWVQYGAAGSALYAARLAPTGALFNAGAPAVVPGFESDSPLLIARPGPHFLLASRSNSSIRGLRMGDDFTALDATPFVVSGAPAPQRKPAFAWNGTHYLAVWEDQRLYQRLVFATRLARDGTPLSPLARRVSAPGTSVGSPAVASDGQQWLVSWTVSRSGATRDLRSARVTASGDVLDDGGVTLASFSGAEDRVSVAWLGDRYGVVYGTQRPGPPYDHEVWAQAVGRDGLALPDAGVLVAQTFSRALLSPRVAAWDGGALVVWQDFRDGGFDIVGARLGPGLQTLDPQGFVIVREPGAQTVPDLAAGPEGLVACWSDGPSYPRTTRAARVSFSGGVLDDGGLLLTAAGQDFALPCAAVWDGEQFFVAWSGRTGSVPFSLGGAWLTFDGGVVPDGGLRLSPATQGAVGEQDVALGSPGHRQVLVGFMAERLPDAGFVSRVRTRLLTRGSAPIASAASATTPEDTAVTVPLVATDTDGDPVRFLVVHAPDAGVATSVDGGVRYQPAPDFHGADLFQVVADDGALLSAPVEVAVTVTPVDDPPVAALLAVELDEDTVAPVPVPTRDVDGERLTFAVLQAPAHGVVSGQPPSVVYTPTADFSGADAFTYVLSDARSASAPALVTVTVRPVADAPIAVAATVTTAEDTPVDLVLAATDADGDALTFEVQESPARGTLTGQAPTLRYAPAADFAGEDRLVFRASDGTATSTAEVRLVVTPVNDGPTAADLRFDATAGVPLDFSLQGTDPESAPLAFRVVTGPSQGGLTGEAPALTYTAEASFVGEDHLDYEVADEAGAVAAGTVRFVVAAAPKPPSCTCGGAGLELAAALTLLAWRRRRGVTRTRC